MNVLRTSGLFIGLMTLGFGVFNVCGQEPNTIEEAIEKIKAITDPDPFRQDRLRAEEAKRIVSKRVKVLNDVSGTLLQTMPVDVWNWLTEDGNLKTRGQVLDAARAKGWDLAKVAWLIEGGQCDEHASLMQRILQGAGVQNVKIFISDHPHAFPVVNAAPDAEADIPWTWGPNAFVPDSWANETWNAVDTWHRKIYFNNGESFVGGTEKKTKDRPAAGKTARQLLQEFGERRELAERNCDQYGKLLRSYFKIPIRYRKTMSHKAYRPPEDWMLEEGEKELGKITQAITRDLKDLKVSDVGYELKTRQLHAQLSDLDGRTQHLSKCYEEVELFRKKITETYKLIPKLKTDATIGVSDTGLDEVPDDIIQNTGQVKVDQYFVFLLTNASNGLYIGTIESIKTAVRCSFIGGGINCKPTDLVAYKKLLGPFATSAEAQDALCKSITESRIFPIGVGLKGRWQGGNTWYGLWDVSISSCPAR